MRQSQASAAWPSLRSRSRCGARDRAVALVARGRAQERDAPLRLLDLLFVRDLHSIGCREVVGLRAGSMNAMELTPEEQRKRSQRNYAIAGALLALVVLIFIV